ncbi:hypothetical protein GCM10022255_085500 [Dactylosporangium darangshiense]|uniref:Uncharacterized protein n=1 Tax=Dactylosporangium darangshiense TaxID=579108 RepID=A0ABP8DMI3_9ACTN
MSDRDVADPGAGFDWLTSDGTTLWWLESRPSSGRSVLMRWDAGRLATYGVAGGIGSTLHAYGGQPYTVLEPDQVVAVDASTGQLVGVPPNLDNRYVRRSCSGRR